MLGSGFIGEFHTDGLRYVPDVRVAANYGAGPERREASPRATGAGRTTRSTGSAPTPTSTSSSSRCRTTSTSRRSGRRRGRQGRGLHEAARPERGDEAAEMLRLVEEAGRLPRLPREQRLHDRDGADAGDRRVGRHRAAADVARPRGPQRARTPRTSGMPRWRAAAHSSTWRSHGIEAARYILGKDAQRGGGVRLGRDARPWRSDHRRGQRDHDRPLRGRAGRDDGRVVDGQGRPRGPQRDLLRRRPDHPRPRGRRRSGRSSSGRRGTSPRRPTPTPAGSSRSPTRPASSATTR